jgi:hypothetical protein
MSLDSLLSLDSMAAMASADAVVPAGVRGGQRGGPGVATKDSAKGGGGGGMGQGSCSSARRSGDCRALRCGWVRVIATLIDLGPGCKEE